MQVFNFVANGLGVIPRQRTAHGTHKVRQEITPLIANIVFKDGVTFTATSVLTVEYSCPNDTFNAAQCPRSQP